MGQGADSEAVAAGAGPPSPGSDREGGPSPPQLPPPREAVPTFLQAQDAAWAARDSETLSSLPSPRARCSARRRPVTPTSPRQLREPIHPRGRPVFTSGRGRGACSGGGAPLQVPMSPSRCRQVPSKDSFSRFEVFRGPLGGPALPAGSESGGREGRGPGLRCSARLAPLLLPLPPPCLASSLPSPPPFLRSALPRRHCRHATVTTAAAAELAALSLLSCSRPACTHAALNEAAEGR